jgi:hypothetical protein
MQHKGNAGKVEFDDEADIFHGEAIGLRVSSLRHHPVHGPPALPPFSGERASAPSSRGSRSPCR